jgi:hypothetical protein
MSKATGGGERYHRNDIEILGGIDRNIFQDQGCEGGGGRNDNTKSNTNNNNDNNNGFRFVVFSRAEE